MDLEIIAVIAANGAIGTDGHVIRRVNDFNDWVTDDRTADRVVFISGQSSLQVPCAHKAHSKILISSRCVPQEINPGIHWVKRLKEAFDLARQIDHGPPVILGGQSLFQSTIHFATTLWLARIEEDLIGDRHFPFVDPADWDVDVLRRHDRGEYESYSYRVERWERKGSAYSPRIPSVSHRGAS